MKLLKALNLIPIFATFMTVATQSPAGSLAGRLGIEGGGDKLLSLQFTNGDTNHIKAGNGAFFEIGYGTSTPLQNDPALQTEFSFGYKIDSETASNGEVEFRRLSVNLNQMIKLEKFRLGGGLTYHFDNKFKTRGSFFNGGNVEFDKSLGINLMAEYLASDRAVFGIRATIIEYEANGATVDGNSIGLYLGANY
ncbi:MAG: hypothetical protein V3U65_00845 [Granulosicoccaceae bacterium]